MLMRKSYQRGETENAIEQQRRGRITEEKHKVGGKGSSARMEELASDGKMDN